jgi:Group II intron, maturase-specific domain
MRDPEVLDVLARSRRGLWWHCVLCCPHGARCCPVEDVVQDINRFLRGWSGDFRYRNSDHSFDKISHYATERPARFVGKRHRRGWGYTMKLVAYQSPSRLGLINLNGTHRRPATNRPWRPGRECTPVKNVKEQCAGKSHGRFDVGDGTKPGQSARPRTPAPPADPPRDATQPPHPHPP